MLSLVKVCEVFARDFPRVVQERLRQHGPVLEGSKWTLLALSMQGGAAHHCPELLRGVPRVASLTPESGDRGVGGRLQERIGVLPAQHLHRSICIAGVESYRAALLNQLAVPERAL